MQNIVIHQMILFFTIFMIGLLSAKGGIIAKEGLPQIAKVVTRLLMPVWIFSASYFNIDWPMIRDNVIIFLLSASSYLILTVVLKLIGTAMGLKEDRQKAFRFAFTFGNLGMIGIPLMLYLYPKTGGLFMALFSIVDQGLFWTYGLYLATDSDQKTAFSFKNFVNPNVLAIFIGLALAGFGIKLPAVAGDILNSLKNGFPALGMLYLGALFYYSGWKDALKHKELYIGIGIKMILLPVVLGKLLLLTPLPTWIVYATALTIALPTMTVVPMIASLYGKEGAYTSGITVVTLLAGIFTLPLVAGLIG